MPESTFCGEHTVGPNIVIRYTLLPYTNINDCLSTIFDNIEEILDFFTNVRSDII